MRARRSSTGCSGIRGSRSVALGSDSLAGSPAGALDVRLNGSLPAFVSNEEALAAGADVVFACLRRTSGRPCSTRPRTRSSSTSRARTGSPTPRSTRPGTASSIRSPTRSRTGATRCRSSSPPAGPLVANPGCYATAAILALAPLAEIVDPASVVVDAKSGVSGAGRELKASSHAGFVLENLAPYRIGSHQHAPEIAQAVGFPVCFVPHLLPVRRGLLVTCYVAADGDARGLLEEAYASSPAVRVLPEGVAPELARVQHTDGAEIGVFDDRATGRTIVVCALDNLGKGAAGQAMQNANLALGLDETAGLLLSGVLV